MSTMKVRLDRATLADAATWVGQAISKRPTMPSMGGIRLTAVDNRLTLAAFDYSAAPNSNAPGRRNEDDVNLVAFQPQAAGDTGLSIAETAPCLSVGRVAGIAETVRSHPRPGSNSTGQTLATETTVRRLTPTECGRLQGFPDGHTDTSNGKPQADSPRYKQYGNAVAVPVFEWVMRRVVEVDS